MFMLPTVICIVTGAEHSQPDSYSSISTNRKLKPWHALVECLQQLQHLCIPPAGMWQL